MSEELRVLTYNVRSLRDDPRAVAAVIRAVDPDVVALQEAPRLLRWRHHCGLLARRSGLEHVGGGAGTGGTAMLVHPRVTVLEAYARELSRRSGLHRRGTVLARLRVGGVEVVVGSMHLGLDQDQRLDHVGELLAQAPPGSRLVLAGDLNEAPGGPAWRALADGGLRDAWECGSRGGGPTFSARRPRSRIDAVFLGDGVDVCWAGVPEDLLDPHLLASASDHRPVLAVVSPAQRAGR